MRSVPAGKHPPGPHTTLADYGVTIAYAPLDGDARWHADTRTLILREDADTRTHIELLLDLIDIAPDGSGSRLGAAPRRHLHLVPA